MGFRNFFNELNRDIYVPANKRNGLVSGGFYRTNSLRSGRPQRVDPLSLRNGMGGPGIGGPGIGMNGTGGPGIGGYSGFGMNGTRGPENSKFVSKKMAEMNGKSLSEKLAELERMRKKHNLLMVSGIAAIVIFILLVMFSGVSSSAIIMALPLFGTILGVTALILIARSGGVSSQDDFKALYKSIFVEDVLANKFQNLFYSWKTGFPDMAVSSFNLVKMGNRFKSEDYICATYKGVRFETSDVTIQQHTSTGKSSHTTTYFRGRMFVFYMPKTIQASVRITPDAFIYTPASNRRLEKLDLENVYFNKQYNVYASDPHYAFYLLTPSMMERILYLKGKYGYIILNFEADRVFAAVPMTAARDTFDADMSRAIDYPTDRAKAEADANVICDLMEVLEAVPRG